MTSRLLRIAAGIVAAPLLALVPTAAFADSTGSIDQVENDNGEMRVLFSVPDLATGADPDPASIAVSLNGETVDATAKNVAEDADAIGRTTVLAIDVSMSMSGAPFEAAKEAASAYVDGAPDDVSIGLVTFADDVATVQEPTDDRAALEDAIGSLSLTRKTHLYDGILQALDVAGGDGQRTVLLLSDGKDTSTTSLEAVTSAAADAEVRIDVVALNQRVDASSPLAQIATATEGSVTSTSDIGELETLFAQEAAALSKQLSVSFTVPDELGAGEGTLRVAVSADGTDYSDDAYVSFAGGQADMQTAAPYTTTTDPRFAISKPVLIGAIVMMFVGLGGLLAFGMTRMMPTAATPMQQQLALYTAEGMRSSTKGPAVQSGGAQLKESAVRMAEGIVQKRDLEVALSAKLDRAGMSLKAAEWLLLHAGIAIGSAFLGLLLTGGNLVLTLLLFVGGAVLPWMFLSFKASRRMKKFNAGLAQTLQIIAGALQAGLSLPQAVDTVVKEGDEAVASEFRRAIIEQRLGVDIEDSLDSVAERMASEDFKWVVMAVRIQREVGGNLAELLLTVAATLREREYLRRQVQVLSAEGKMSAYILGALPPGFFLYLMVARPTYLDPMIHTSLGLLMLGVASVMMVIGAFWMKKTVKVEV